MLLNYLANNSNALKLFEAIYAANEVFCVFKYVCILYKLIFCKCLKTIVANCFKQKVGVIMFFYFLVLHKHYY